MKALERIYGRSLIERTIDCLSLLCQEILVVTSREQFSVITAAGLGGRVVVDCCPGMGALGGIYTGLAVTDSFHSLVVACDMPFLSRKLLHYLIDLAPDYDVVVPKIKGMYEPLHAVYSKKCLSAIGELLEKGELAISRLFSLVKVKYVGIDEVCKLDPELLSFFNVNTLEDLRKAEALFKTDARYSMIKEG